MGTSCWTTSRWTTYGKWILTGEHAVLRGAPALVFPLRERKMDFTFQSAAGTALHVEFSGPCGEELKLIFWGLLEEALKKIEITREKLSGVLSIMSDLPIGSGLGASASLCVGVARLFKCCGYLSEDELFNFSRELENLFHGESSGVDIAVAITGEPLKFYRQQGRMPLAMGWKPNLYISYSGKRGMTSECVKKVNELLKTNPTLGRDLDRQMLEASLTAEKALSLDVIEGERLLVEAILKSNAVFKAWGLIDSLVEAHANTLLEYGALAVKPTGSGGGGYILSLWKSPPSSEKIEQLGLISAF